MTGHGRFWGSGPTAEVSRTGAMDPPATSELLQSSRSQSQRRTVASVGAGFLARLSLPSRRGMLAVRLRGIELRMTPQEGSHHMIHEGKRKDRPDGAGGLTTFPETISSAASGLGLSRRVDSFGDRQGSHC